MNPPPMDDKIPSPPERRFLMLASFLRIAFTSIAVSLSFWTYRHFGGTGFILPMILLWGLWGTVFWALHQKCFGQPIRRKGITSEKS